MIIYDARKYGGYDVLLHAMGSAIYDRHSLPPALLSASFGLALSIIPATRSYLATVAPEAQPYFASLSFVVSFVLVYRAQIAYQRYDNAQLHYFNMVSKITDFVNFTTSFLQERDPKTIALRRTIIRWARAYHQLALGELQGHLDVLGKMNLTDEELLLLSKERKKSIQVSVWIANLMATHRDTLKTGDAILSRAYQVLTDANLFLNHARRIAETPFPFPFVQLTNFIINIWAITTPTIMAAVYESFAIFATCFFSTWILFAVNEAAAQLETPFDEAANDLPIVYYTLSFDDDMSSIEFGSTPDVSATYTNAPGLTQIAREEMYKMNNNRPTDVDPVMEYSRAGLNRDNPYHALKKYFNRHKKSSGDPGTSGFQNKSPKEIFIHLGEESNRCLDIQEPIRKSKTLGVVPVRSEELDAVGEASEGASEPGIDEQIDVLPPLNIISSRVSKDEISSRLHSLSDPSSRLGSSRFAQSQDLDEEEDGLGARSMSGIDMEDADVEAARQEVPPPKPPSPKFTASDKGNSVFDLFQIERPASKNRTSARPVKMPSSNYHTIGGGEISNFRIAALDGDGTGSASDIREQNRQIREMNRQRVFSNAISNQYIQSNQRSVARRTTLFHTPNSSMREMPSMEKILDRDPNFRNAFMTSSLAVERARGKFALFR